MKSCQPQIFSPKGFSFRRLFALCRKEIIQIRRDPTTTLIAFILPVVMLLIYGYGLNLDTGRTRVGLICEDRSADARQFVASLVGSPYLDIKMFDSRAEASSKLTRQHIRGFIVVPQDFSVKLQYAETMPGRTFPSPIQVICDGTEPNTGNFVQGYAAGAWQNWLAYRAAARGMASSTPAAISVEQVYWYNRSAESRLYLIPGSITIIMTVIGALLTALVIAREWERGTMEALLASPMTRAEFLLSKIIPYYLLGLLVLFLCVGFAHFCMGVPFRGSALMLMACGSLFLLSVLGMGLLISTKTRNQFNAAQLALVVAYLPGMMLSGFVFEISSMPWAIRMVTHIIPARYFVTSMQTLSQVGDVWAVLRWPLLFLTGTACFFLGLTVRATRKHLD